MVFHHRLQLADPDHSRLDRCPRFHRGTINFGAITQSAVAFSALVAAFSLIVTQFQSLSNFAAVLGRLSSMMEAVEQSQTTTRTSIETVEAEGRVAYEQLTLRASANGSPLVEDLSVSIPFGTRVLLTGPNEAARLALFRATAGISTPGAGRIIRPGGNDIFFLTQRPYLPPGTLREVLGTAERLDRVSDDRILALLRELDLERSRLRLMDWTPGRIGTPCFRCATSNSWLLSMLS